MVKRAKNALKRFFYNSSFLLRNNKIVLESLPDCADSSLCVFEELLRRKINNRCKIIWLLNNPSAGYRKYKNVRYVNRNSILGKYHHFSAKIIIDSNCYVHKIRNSQFRLHLTHGSSLKLAFGYAREAGLLDATIVLSDYFVPIHAYLFDIDESRTLPIGLPRNDRLLNSNHIQLKKKTIIWMPTYRNHRRPGSIHTGIALPFGIPCISTAKELEILNERLKKYDMDLVIKLHPAEDTSHIKRLPLSNIALFDESALASADYQLYDVLKDTDALITDYSSVYYDYLLTQKPIALAIPDIAEFRKTYDLISNNYEKDIKGYHLYSFNDLLAFVDDIAKGKNKCRDDLKIALKRYHKYIDGKSSSRVVDIIEKEMGRK